MRSGSLPESWSWWIQDLIPSLVKERFSPNESWKQKPFHRDDLDFFFKGINELSELFTVERKRKIPPYFRHERFRSAYLLYFLPLQAAKFLFLFQLHAGAMQAALSAAKKEGVLRIADLGAGPGTASLSLLLWLLEEKRLGHLQSIPKVEFTWLDTERSILEDGKLLLEKLTQFFPSFRDKISMQYHVEPWWNASRFLHPRTSLIIMGNVLNENIPDPSTQGNKTVQAIESILKHSTGGGTLFLEVASLHSSQFLSKIRDKILDPSLRSKTSAFPVWGPCLHASECPLSQGRDWCHLSVPTEIPGTWFKMISKKLGSERSRLKFSYLWLASRDFPAPTPKKYQRRVISDLIATSPRDTALLLCEPEQPKKIPWKASPHYDQNPHRGDILDV